MRPPLVIASLLDSPGESHFAASARWLEALLLGEVGVILATLTVAVTGLLFLTGRLAWRASARIVLGCAIMFGAPAIAAGLMATGERRAASRLQTFDDRAPINIRDDVPPAQERSGASLRRD